MRLGLRLRLTLVYVAFFCVTGAALVGLNYVLLSRSAYEQPSSQALEQARAALAGSAGIDLKARAQNLESQLRTQLRQQALDELLSESAVVLGLVSLISIAAGWFVAGRALRPVRDIIETAKRASGDNLHERINLNGPRDELKELADTFDEMLSRLEDTFESQKRFVANASHELRTPLATIGTSVDVVLAKPRPTKEQWVTMAHNVRAATDRAERLIESLLVLARSERGLAEHDRVDLAESATEALQASATLAAEKHLRVVSTIAPAPVLGDKALLDRMVANLVENAVRHNRSDGWIELATGVDGDSAYVRVANSGRVVGKEDLLGLVEPFRRGQSRVGSEKGAGLGLSIVRSVARAHGGDVTPAALSDGGLKVLVQVPAVR